MTEPINAPASSQGAAVVIESAKNSLRDACNMLSVVSVLAGEVSLSTGENGICIPPPPPTTPFGVLHGLLLGLVENFDELVKVGGTKDCGGSIVFFLNGQLVVTGAGRATDPISLSSMLALAANSVFNNAKAPAAGEGGN